MRFDRMVAIPKEQYEQLKNDARNPIVGNDRATRHGLVVVGEGSPFAQSSVQPRADEAEADRSSSTIGSVSRPSVSASTSDAGHERAVRVTRGTSGTPSPDRRHNESGTDDDDVFLTPPAKVATQGAITPRSRIWREMQTTSRLVPRSLARPTPRKRSREDGSLSELSTNKVAEARRMMGPVEKKVTKMKDKLNKPGDKTRALSVDGDLRGERTKKGKRTKSLDKDTRTNDYTFVW
jgi:hypothetical protein